MNTVQMKTLKRCRRFFTLIEMIIVIGIVSILMALGAASIIRLSQGAPVKRAVTAVSGKLSVARSLAASRNAYVAVILPSDKATPDDLAGRCLLVMEVETDAKPTDKVKSFRPKAFLTGQDWTTIPFNSVILSDASGSDESATGRLVQKGDLGFCELQNQSKGTGLDRIELRMGKSKLPMSMPAIVFNPQGQPETSDLTGVILFVAEGKVNGTNVTGNLANRTMITINPFTGRVKVYEDEDEDEEQKS